MVQQFAHVFRWVTALAERAARDDIFSYAAAMAYNLLFAFFPLLLFLSALLGFLHLSPNIREVFSGPLSQLLPASLLSFIAGAWRQLILARHPTLLSLGGLGFIWGMSGAFRQLIDAINHAYEFPLPRRRSLWKTVLLSLLTGLGVGLLMTLAVLLVVLGPSAVHSVLKILFRRELSAITVAIIRWLGLVVLLWWTLTVLYAVLPDHPRHLRLLNPGTLAALAIWIVISFGFSQYTDHFHTYGRVYGGLGTIILLMLYLYFAGLALVLGAEVSAITDPASPPHSKNPEDGFHH